MQDFSQSRSHYQKEQAGYQAAYTELCRHLEHAPLEQLLSDHTAVLVFGTAPERRDEALRMIKGQLYSRNSRDTGRVESWFADCCARIQEDREGFLQNAQLTYIRQGLAEEERQQKAAKAAKEHGRFRVRPASAFAPETAEYLVEPYLPKGMLSILGGVSGVGKTSLALDICARLSRGTTPPVIACGDASPILYLTAENDPNKVLRPGPKPWGPTWTSCTSRMVPATAWAMPSLPPCAACCGLGCWCSTPSRAIWARACR